MVNTANARSCRKKKGFLRDSLNTSGASKRHGSFENQGGLGYSAVMRGWKIVTVLI